MKCDYRVSVIGPGFGRMVFGVGADAGCVSAIDSPVPYRLWKMRSVLNGV